MKEVVKIWIEKFENGDRTKEDEIVQVQGTIDNETIWRDGSEGEAWECHNENIEALTEYLEWLENN